MTEKHTVVVLDQSYEGYTDAPLLSAREACATGNVVQIHSMTKDYAVPGLRLGYVVAHRRLTARLRRFLRPWSVSALAIEAGKYLLHEATACRPDLGEARRLWQRLNAIDGIALLPTRTNFMLGTVDGRTAGELKQFLATEHAMLIRDASNFQGLSPHHFRVAAQSPEENDALVSAIAAFCKETHANSM